MDGVISRDQLSQNQLSQDHFPEINSNFLEINSYVFKSNQQSEWQTMLKGCIRSLEWYRHWWCRHEYTESDARSENDWKDTGKEQRSLSPNNTTSRQKGSRNHLDKKTSNLDYGLVLNFHTLNQHQISPHFNFQFSIFFFSIVLTLTPVLVIHAYTINWSETWRVASNILRYPVHIYSRCVRHCSVQSVLFYQRRFEPISVFIS